MAKKTPAKKAAPKKAIVKKPAKKAAVKKEKKKDRLTWFDVKAQKPVIDQYAQRLGTFLETVADGIVDDAEVAAQEARLVKLMKEVEPMLDDDQHTKVTQLLCELTAYDLMHMMHRMEQARPKTVFQG